jgi:GT2 family glycosyltransferase
MQLEVIVVDNASLLDVASWRERYPQIVWVVQSSNRGFASGVNVGLDRATALYVLIQNPDAWLLDGSLERLVERLDQAPQVAAVTPQLVDLHGALQPSGGAAPTLARIIRRETAVAAGLRARSQDSATELDWASATALLCRRSALDAVGGMDDGFFLYYEDCDLGLRLRRSGWHIELVSSARAVHVGGVSFADDSGAQLRAYLKGQNRYFQKHRPLPERWALLILQSLYQWTGMRRVMRGAHR